MNPESEEYASITCMFSANSDKILNIKKVISTKIRSKFDREAEKLRCLRSREIEEGKAVQMLQLFHGTPSGNIKSILKNGFEKRRAGSNGITCLCFLCVPGHVSLLLVGTLYGRGVYFATDPSMALGYARPDPVANTQVLLYCNVLIGMYTVGDKDMIMPPPISQHKYGSQDNLYDSTVNDVENPSIFVSCYKGNHYAFPTYVITVKAD